MTTDELKVYVNGVKEQIADAELRLDQAGYRELARILYDARLKLSHELHHIVGWPAWEHKSNDRG